MDERIIEHVVAHEAYLLQSMTTVSLADKIIVADVLKNLAFCRKSVSYF